MNRYSIALGKEPPKVPPPEILRRIEEASAINEKAWKALRANPPAFIPASLIDRGVIDWQSQSQYEEAVRRRQVEEEVMRARFQDNLRQRHMQEEAFLRQHGRDTIG